MDRIAGWWDGLELWIVGLAFVPQVALVLVVVVPLCALGAWLLDRVLAAVLVALRRGPDTAPDPDTVPDDESGDAPVPDTAAAPAKES
ncbi:hypothetical protein [Rhodococcus rhodnii]|uniref:hypothetical protein n=1 Tax=Rhodococcus rhodnii TaxID=38312 RepID=UPI00068518EC|nr:hypothetical protein [Rhodococcus rhodnii]